MSPTSFSVAANVGRVVSIVTRVLPGVLNVQTSGLCGGMVMSALDYWRAGVPIPLHEPGDLGPTALPSEASRMRQYTRTET